MVRKAPTPIRDDSDALEAIAEPSARLSTPFNVVPLYSVVCFNDPDYPEYAGFCIEARNNVTNRERRELRRKNQEIVEYSQWWTRPDTVPGTTHEEFGEYNEEDTPNLRQAAMLSPYIRNWNAQGQTDDGDFAPLPPPAKIGADALEYLDPPQTDWIVSLLLVALVQGKGLSASAKAFDALHEARSNTKTDGQN